MKYISIKSILYDVSRILPDSFWNEADILEWATKAYRRLNIEHMYETKVQYIPLKDHKADLPNDLRFLNQIAWLSTFTEVTTYENFTEWTLDPTHIPQGFISYDSGDAKKVWQLMHPSTNLFHNSITCSPSMSPNDDLNSFRFDFCSHKYTVDTNLTLTSTLKDGILAVSYLRFPMEDCNTILIPDNETLKEALFNYIMHIYYLKKSILGDPNANREAIHHKRMYVHLGAKASAEITSPDLATMENIKNLNNRLVPRSFLFDGMFNKLGSPEQLSF